MKSLTDALRANDMEQIRTILGSEGDEILSSGDPVADAAGRQKFLSLFDEQHKLSQEAADTRTLVLGKTEWPFPVPIARNGKGWYFDSAAGKEELLNRRIGANELSAIEVCKAIIDAQREYALLDPDRNGINEYAQQFASDPGKRNGLYWPVVEGEPLSPLGELAAEASGEGYKRKSEGPTPYHGYYYRILKEQGPHAPGGEMSYMVKNNMTLGVAIVAYPAEYDNSGVMTFIISTDGAVYQKDLGKDTHRIASKMTTFDPDKSWKKVD
jgi:hypothetical protein